MAELAQSDKLDKKQREQLYDAAEKELPAATVVVTKSMLQRWQPQITDNNACYILGRRNREAANRMVVSMSKRRK